MIWHVNCFWLFVKILWQSFLLNILLFKNSHIFNKNHQSMNFFSLVISSPKYILTYAKKQRFYLAWFLEKPSWQRFLVKNPLFTKMSYFFLKITDPWNILLVISSPEYILLTCAKKQWFYFVCLLKNTSRQSFKSLDKKAIFTQKMMELWNYLYALNGSLNQYISINDLTCKVCLRDILLSTI